MPDTPCPMPRPRPSTTNSRSLRTLRQFSPGEPVLLKRHPLKKHPKLGPLLCGQYQVLRSTSSVLFRNLTHNSTQFSKFAWLKSYLTCSKHQNDDEDGQTPDLLLLFPSSLGLVDEPVHHRHSSSLKWPNRS